MRRKIAIALLLCACARKHPTHRTPLRVTIDDFGADSMGNPRVRVVRASPVTLHGSVEGPAESVRCNNLPAAVSAGRWQCTVTIIDTGQGMGINVIAQDRERTDIALAYIGVMMDTIPPSAKITLARRKGDSILVEGEAGDNFPGMTVTVNGIDAPVHDARFSVVVPASNEIRAVARDAVGNTATTSLTRR